MQRYEREQSAAERILINHQEGKNNMNGGGRFLKKFQPPSKLVAATTNHLAIPISNMKHHESPRDVHHISNDPDLSDSPPISSTRSVMVDGIPTIPNEIQVKAI
jgi:hypothetical protein